MRASEFLIEYNREITARQTGDKLILSLGKDTSADLGTSLNNARRIFKSTLRTTRDTDMLNLLSPEQKGIVIDDILSYIEQKDPTPNKNYTPWLAKMYAKSGGGVSLEDLNRQDMIRLYDIAKKRRMIKPEHMDINSFKWYHDFEDTMESEYNNLNDVEISSRNNNGMAEKVYEDEDVTVIVPKDEAAACKYGRNTRWCTAATRGTNYFDEYNASGPLYILIPKKPEYANEKYQLHFPSEQYMDENDDRVVLYKLLMFRFPGLVVFFKKVASDFLKKFIIFAPDEEIAETVNSVARLVDEHLIELLHEWGEQEDGYHKWLLQHGYEDEEEEGYVDWDRVEEDGINLTQYSEEAKTYFTDVKKVVRPTPEQVKQATYEMLNNNEIDEEFATLKQLNKVIAQLVFNYFGKDHDMDLGNWLEHDVVIRYRNEKYFAYQYRNYGRWRDRRWTF